MLLYFAPNDQGRPRLGITASRKVGNAVHRQRLKRRIREIYRRWDRLGSLPAIDLVVHLKPASRKADFQPFQRELRGLLGSVQQPPKER